MGHKHSWGNDGALKCDVDQADILPNFPVPEKTKIPRTSRARKNKKIN